MIQLTSTCDNPSTVLMCSNLRLWFCEKLSNGSEVPQIMANSISRKSRLVDLDNVKYLAMIDAKYNTNKYNIIQINISIYLGAKYFHFTRE
jgi:hypothetical protein